MINSEYDTLTKLAPSFEHDGLNVLMMYSAQRSREIEHMMMIEGYLSQLVLNAFSRYSWYFLYDLIN